MAIPVVPFKLVVVLVALTAPVLAVVTTREDKSQGLCVGAGGAYVALVGSDRESRTLQSSLAPQTTRGGKVVEIAWQPTTEKEDATSPRNAFTGTFLQALPDVGVDLTNVKSAEDIMKHMPAIEVTLRISKEGVHTMFLRWTGGDKVGGGDSLYAIMLDVDNKVIPGEDTFAPSQVPIDDPKYGFIGCCYNMHTHACPCFKTKPTKDECPPAEGGQDLFQTTDKATKFGATCLEGPGKTKAVRAPKWFEFAGLESGNSMDFDAEPWDATCEAEGTGTHDTGRDFAQWKLDADKTYRLRLYAREDGTAVDAVYIAGPEGVDAPDASRRYRAGESTLCHIEDKKGGGGSSFGLMLGIILFVTILCVAVASTCFVRSKGYTFSSPTAWQFPNLFGRGVEELGGGGELLPMRYQEDDNSGYQPAPILGGVNV